MWSAIWEEILKKYILLSTAIVACLGQGSAFSQTDTEAADADRRDSLLMQRVTVTATRREESLADVPVSVTAVSDEQVEAFRVQNVSDLQVLVPNFSVSQVATSPTDPVLQIRGLLQRASDATLDTAVGVYSDEVFLARGYSVLGTMLDVERIEVLRGPQGTLFGRNTIGGAVQVVSKAPQIGEELSGQVSGSVGNFNLFEARGAVNVPLGDKAAFRLAGLSTQHDGYTTSYLVDDTGGYVDGVTPILEEIDTDNDDTQALRASFAVEFGESSRFDLSHYYSKSDTNGTMRVGANGDIGGGDGTFPIPPLTPFGGRPTSVARSQFNQGDFYGALTDVRPTGDSEVNITIAKYTQGIGENMDLKIIASHAEAEHMGVINTDGIVTPPEGLFRQSHGFVDSQVEQSTFEAQLSGQNGRVDWLAGLYYFEESAQDNNVNAREDRPPFTAATTLIDVDAENTSQSIYGSANVALNDQFTVRLGGRYTEDTKQYDGATTNGANVCVYTGADASLGCRLFNERNFENFTWDVSLDYSPSEATLIYGKIGTGYRTGGISLNANSPETAQGFDEDFVTSYELGLKTDIGDSARLNAALFFVDYSDIQQNALSSNPNSCINAPGPTVIITCNLGDAESQGIEIDGVWQVTDAFGLQAGVGYTDFSFGDGVTGPVYTPEWTYSLTGVYDFDLRQKPGRILVSYQQSDEWTANDVLAQAPFSSYDGYELLNARATLNLSDNLEVSAWGQNILEDEYFGSGIGAFVPVFAIYAGSPGAPRTYGVDVKFTF